MDEASILYREGKYDDSLVCLKEALTINKKDPQAYFLCGNALQRVGKIDWAIAAFRSAQMLAPMASELHSNIANMYLRLGEFAFAASEYKRALQKNADDRVAKDNLKSAERLASEILQGSLRTIVIDNYGRRVNAGESKRFHFSNQQILEWVNKSVPPDYKNWPLFLYGSMSTLPESMYVFHGFYPSFSFGDSPAMLFAGIPKSIFWQMRSFFSSYHYAGPFEHTRTLEERFWLGPDGVQRFYLLFDDKHKITMPLRFLLPREHDDLMRGTNNHTIIIHPWVTTPKDASDWQSQPFDEVTIYLSLNRSSKSNTALSLIWGPKVKCFNCERRLEEHEARVFATINKIIPAIACRTCFEKCQSAVKSELTSKILKVAGELYGPDTIDHTRVNSKLVLTPVKGT
jgi:hypothetical protein